MARPKKTITVDKEHNQVYVNGNLLRNPTEYDMVEDYYTNVQEYFANGQTKGNSHLANVMQKFFKNAEKNMDKSAWQNLSTMKLYQNLYKDTQEYLESKKEQDTDFSKYLLRDKLFSYQRNVFDDTNKKKTMLWGRRAGKTHTAVRLALKAALEKDTKKREIIIMGLTLEKTAGLYWDQLKEAVKDAHIVTQKIDNGSYTITLANGNYIQLWGNNSKAEREKLRGRDTYMFIIDEMQSQQGLYYLLTDIMGPIIKGRGGEIVCLGTAPIYAGTMWEKILSDPAYSHSHATMEDNPTIPDYQHALEQVLIDNHWSKDNITFRREYLGEVAYDTERMILPTRQYYSSVDIKPNKIYIGVDYGWADYSSFAPILIDEAKGQMRLYKEWKQNKTASSDIVKQMKDLVTKLHEEFNVPMEDIKVVADSSHQQISQDIYNQGVLNIQNAYKLDENYQWARLAEELAVGNLKIKKDDFFDMECDQLVWEWNQEKGCIIYKVDDDVFHPDIADSVKYAVNTYLTDKNAEMKV